MDVKAKEETELIYRSRVPDIYIPKHLPRHYCMENFSKSSSRPCLINGATNQMYTFAEIELISLKVASGLNKHGIQQGDVIMILLPNSPEFGFAIMGASYRGAISTMANPFFTSAEVVKQAKASNAKIILTQSACVDKIKDFAAENGVKIICVDTAPEGYFHYSELSSADENELPEVEINPDDVVALPYSSGTTGLPKGVMLTYKGLVTSVARQVDGENPNFYIHEKVMISVLPLFHIYSLNSILLCGLRAGTTLLIMQKIEIVQFLELIQKYKVTVGAFVPPIFFAIAKIPVVDNYDLTSMKTVTSGAAPLGKEIEDTVRAKFPNAKLSEGYGMIEARPVLAMCSAFAKEPFEVKSGGCGSVVRNAEMKIVDPDSGSSLPQKKPAEICMRGDQIMKVMSMRKLYKVALLLVIINLIFNTNKIDAQAQGKKYSFDYFIVAHQSAKVFCNQLFQNTHHTQTCGRDAPQPNTFVLHGLWPQNFRTRFLEDCYKYNNYRRIRFDRVDPPQNLELDQIMPNLKYWCPSIYHPPNQEFWRDEYLKHGSCCWHDYSQTEYFNVAMELKRRVNISENLAGRGILSGDALALNDYQNALKEEFNVIVDIICVWEEVIVGENLPFILEFRMCYTPDARSLIDCVDNPGGRTGKLYETCPTDGTIMYEI